jgi:hypothetical protein
MEATMADQQATDEILTVSRVAKDSDGSWIVKCPHCKRVIGLEDGPIRGEQFQHRACGGWLEVSHDAKVMLP